MMFLWKPEMVRFMKEASEYNPFYQGYARRIEQHIPLSAHICDAGCGLGYLSLELSKKYRKVTGIDISASPLNVFRENVRIQGSHNVEIIEEDIWMHRPESSYEGMVFCFFGDLMESLQIGKRHCSGTLILINRAWHEHRFSTNQRRINGFIHSKTEKQLEDLQIPHFSEVFEVEMGQPFRNLSDAKSFFRLYGGTESDEESIEEAVRLRLEKRDSDVFPFYLPMKRQVGMITIQTKDIPDDLDKIDKERK